MQSRTEDDRTPDNTGETVIPLLAEEVAVAKQVIQTGRGKSRESLTSESS
jgi:hypothetical protein